MGGKGSGRGWTGLEMEWKREEDKVKEQGGREGERSGRGS